MLLSEPASAAGEALAHSLFQVVALGIPEPNQCCAVSGTVARRLGKSPKHRWMARIRGLQLQTHKVHPSWGPQRMQCVLSFKSSQNQTQARTRSSIPRHNPALQCGHDCACRRLLHTPPQQARPQPTHVANDNVFTDTGPEP